MEKGGLEEIYMLSIRNIYNRGAAYVAAKRKLNAISGACKHRDL